MTRKWPASSVDRSLAGSCLEKAIRFKADAGKMMELADATGYVWLFGGTGIGFRNSWVTQTIRGNIPFSEPETSVLTRA